MRIYLCVQIFTVPLKRRSICLTDGIVLGFGVGWIVVAQHTARLGHHCGRVGLVVFPRARLPVAGAISAATVQLQQPMHRYI